MSDAIVVLVTVAAQEDGERLASVLVGEHLAACVNILGPIRSVYRWEGAVQHDEEFLLLIKTRAALFGQLEQRVRATHSYQTPEVIALPVTAGSAPYLQWLLEMTSRSGPAA